MYNTKKQTPSNLLTLKYMNEDSLRKNTKTQKHQNYTSHFYTTKAIKMNFPKFQTFQIIIKTIYAKGFSAKTHLYHFKQLRHTKQTSTESRLSVKLTCQNHGCYSLCVETDMKISWRARIVLRGTD